MSQSKRRPIALALLVVFALSGCSLRAPMKRFSTQEEVGTVHVAVQSIARFDDAYTDELQPHFDLTSEAALNAISQTQVSEMERLRALLAELNIAGQKRTVTSERTLDKGEVTKETSTEKTDAPDLSTTGAEPAAKALANTAPAVIAASKLQLDQSLRYRAAAALIQEIALFNRYVRDAAVTRDTIPYVVRLLVTVNPSARREPYDVYTSISFFSSEKPDFHKEAAELTTYDAYKNTSTSDLATQLRSAIGANACERAVEVIPLFVTDNLESSLNSSANERNLDGSGGGSGFFANFAATLGFRAQAVDRDRSVGQGLNGLTTISRLGNNTVLARLGASNANNQYEMVARTYNVTLLALVPTTAGLAKTGNGLWPFTDAQYSSLQTVTPCSDLTFTAYSRFRDSERGREVPTAYEVQRPRALGELVKSWQLSSPAGTSVAAAVNQLLLLAEMGEYTTFGTEAKKLTSPIVDLRDGAIRNMLWHDLVRLSHISGRSYGKFQLPERIDRFFSAQEVTLFDDGKKTTVVVNGGRNLSVDGLHARIEAADATNTNLVFLDETDVKISGDRHRATFTFPSIEARLGSKPGTSPKFVASKIVSGARGVQTTTDLMTAKRVTYRTIDPVPALKPTIMAITAENIRLASGAGEFAIAFTSDKSKPVPTVLVEVVGGTINTVTPAAVVTGNGIEVAAQGNYVIALKNLFPDTPVKVRALLADGTAIGDKTLTVKP